MWTPLAEFRNRTGGETPARVRSRSCALHRQLLAGIGSRMSLYVLKLELLGVPQLLNGGGSRYCGYSFSALARNALGSWSTALNL